MTFRLLLLATGVATAIHFPARALAQQPDPERERRVQELEKLEAPQATPQILALARGLAAKAAQAEARLEAERQIYQMAQVNVETFPRGSRLYEASLDKVKEYDGLVRLVSAKPWLDLLAKNISEKPDGGWTWQFIHKQWNTAFGQYSGARARSERLAQGTPDQLTALEDARKLEAAFNAFDLVFMEGLRQVPDATAEPPGAQPTQREDQPSIKKRPD
jgi:hypothetical protein